MSELAENYKYGNKVSQEIKRLREQASVLATEKLSAEKSYAQQLAHLRESADGHLSAQIAAEEKLSTAEEEVRLLKEQLSASQESLAARLEAVLEAEAVDRFKRSPAYDALLLREFERGMRQSKKFFAMKDHSNEKALRRFDSFFGSGAEPDLGPVAGRIMGLSCQMRTKKLPGLLKRIKDEETAMALLQLVEIQALEIV
ncbi:hypothetical protein LWI29_018626 [Acer saccharum]|uniref:Uncharacterized protein n=1 Tax=Acer saccharum TaxID=4024 RepID=A0AA39TCW6_ACESA|nr:hypothetical protein LWI29_018626 [Acer saccharum]